MVAPGFGELAARLVRFLNERIRRGEISERRLARLLGYSQPHIHNVLSGARGLSLELADRALESLDIPLASLFTPEELRGEAPSASGERPAPCLEGVLGGGMPFPREPTRPRFRFFPSELIERLENPAAARVAASESAMRPFIEPGDWILLDRGAAARARPTPERVYAVNWEGAGYLARCAVRAGRLEFRTDAERAPGPPPRVPLRGRRIGEILVGDVAWIGRTLPAPKPDPPLKKRSRKRKQDL